MRCELLWFIDHVKCSNGIHILKSVEWSPYDKMATMLIGYSDASGIGMGVWFPGEHAGFQCLLPTDGPKDLIFFYEALAICSVFHFGTKYKCDQIAIYSNNTNAEALHLAPNLHIQVFEPPQDAMGAAKK
jgi:hypothetical protein